MNGSNLSYIEQGTGAPVVFVHGAIQDFRYWEPKREAIAKKYRFIACNMRYHGTAPWPDQGEQYTWANHADDTATFIRGLNAGPVHLVGLSMGGFLASLTAEYPELVRSLTLAEPAIGSLLMDIPEGKALLDERNQSFTAIVTAVKAGDAVQASKLLLAWADNQDTAAFDTLSAALRQMYLDNARTIPLFFSMSPPPAVSCATLGRVKAPTLVVRGEQTRRFFALISEVVGRCIPGSRLAIIPQARHLMSYQNPRAFNEVLLQFLAQH